jgi:hypothetical protein
MVRPFINKQFSPCFILFVSKQLSRIQPGQYSAFGRNVLQKDLSGRVAGPDHFNSDPDPTFHFDTDADPDPYCSNTVSASPPGANQQSRILLCCSSLY